MKPVHSWHKRAVQWVVEEALEDMPAVLIHGPRQCGKSTLAMMVGAHLDYQYNTFDDDNERESALYDPVGYVEALPERVILDEVQRVPSLFTSLKRAIDRARRPGRFLLTGSANILASPALGDSLAGRMGVVQLHPFSQAEIEGNTSGFLDRLFCANFPPESTQRLDRELYRRVATGGFPAAIALPDGRRRSRWFQDYIHALIRRDVLDVARVQHPQKMSRLLELCASQTASLLNTTRLAAPFELQRATIDNYVNVLEQLFLVERLQPWYTNVEKRLLKTPKIHIRDSGLGSEVLEMDSGVLQLARPQFGHLLETFVYQELRRYASAHPERHRFSHYRDRDQLEVDIVVERGRRYLAGVEVKLGATIRSDDFRGLQKLQRVTPERFTSGVVLYDGERCVPFGEKLFAVPISFLWKP